MSRGVGHRLCRGLLRLYPGSFRSDYGAEIEAVIAERARETLHHGLPYRLRFWTREVRALLVTAAVLRWEETREGRSRGSRSIPRTSARHELLRAVHPRSGRRAMRDLPNDLRRAIRTLARRPAFAVAAMVTLALGIGATTSIFSAVHAVLLRPLPYAEPERIVTLWQTAPDTGEPEGGVSVANLRDLRERSDLFEAMATAEPYSLDLRTAEGTESLRTWLVTEGFFEAAGAEALLGRTFRTEEYRQGGDRVAVLGFASWQGRFGGDPEVVGRTLTLDGRPATIVGVMRPDFELPAARELWVPRPFRWRDANQRGAAYTKAFARLRPGVSPAAGEAQLRAVFAELERQYPDANAGAGIEVVPLREHLVGGVRPAFRLLLVAVLLVLLVACANVAGLMLARGQDRQRETAVRSALGASRRRLVREVLLESTVLGGAGCALGVGLAFLGIRAMQALRPAEVPRLDEQALDPATLAFAVAVSAASVVAFSLVPALRFSRPELRGSLAEGGRGATAGRTSHRLREGLVVAEVALAVMLLIGGGLLTRSFAKLLANDVGFDPEGRVAAQVFAYGYEEGALESFLADVIQGIETISGVRTVGVTSDLPFAGDQRIAGIEIDMPYEVVGKPPRSGPQLMAGVSVVNGAYFEAMGIDLLDGRTFDRFDTDRGQKVVVVNRALAERHWPGAGPLGREIDLAWDDGSPRRTVVGVVEDVRGEAFDVAPEPEIYLPLEQSRFGSLTFVAWTRGESEAALQPMQRAIWEANPAQSVWGAATLESLLADSTAERRFVLVLLAAFGLLALALAAVGVYGLVSFTTAQRTGELGLRTVLGGGRLELLGLVLRQGLRLTAVGVVLGVTGALVLARLLRSMLFGIEPTDPVSFVVLPALVLATALAATAIPAGRALRVDPAVALRSE